MRIAIFANTPAQIHFYRNISKLLHEMGHETCFAIRDYRETKTVADGYGLDYFVYSKSGDQILGRSMKLPLRVLFSSERLKKFKSDMVLGFGVYDAYVATLLGKPCIEFEDSEPRVNPIYAIELRMYLPFVDTIITPEMFMDDLGEKHIRVRSYKELSYLHPNHFVADENIFSMLDIDRNDDFVLLRFNSFDAVHDTGISGFNLEQKRSLVRDLEKEMKVFISAEGGLPRDLESHRINIPHHKIHDVLFFAKLFISDSQTMATEAGILGTPAIRCNSFVGVNDMSNFRELEQKYGLIFNFSDAEEARKKIFELLSQNNLKSLWADRVNSLLKDKIDMSKFMAWFIDNYPESIHITKEHPSELDRFAQ